MVFKKYKLGSINDPCPAGLPLRNPVPVLYNLIFCVSQSKGTPLFSRASSLDFVFEVLATASQLCCQGQQIFLSPFLLPYRWRRFLIISSLPTPKRGRGEDGDGDVDGDVEMGEECMAHQKVGIDRTPIQMRHKLLKTTLKLAQLTARLIDLQEDD